MVIHREPTITLASVEATLESLKYTAKDVTAARSLYALTLVDDFLDDPSAPVSPLMREFALRHLLTQIITRQYQILIAAPPPAPHAAADTEIYARIQQDVRTENPDLIGWSVLYHLYVITSVSLTQEAYAQQAAIVPRTVYRYKKSALKALTHALIQDEWQVRKKRRQQRLMAILPPPDGIGVIGRETELRHIKAVLANIPRPCITLSGPPGSGKSALVQEVVRYLIDQNCVDYLFWINRPQTLADIESHLREAIQGSRLKSQFADLAAAYSVVVVIENTECLSLSPYEWDNLLSRILGSTTTFITGHVSHLTHRAGLHLVLGDLTPAATKDLVWSLLRSASRDLTGVDAYAETIWQQVGGSPMAIRLAVGLLEQAEVEIFQADILDRLYAHLDATLDRSAQHIWDILTLFPQGLSAASLRSLAEDVVTARLRQHGIIIPVYAGCYALSPSALLYRQTHPAGGFSWAWSLLEHETTATRGWLAEALLSLEMFSTDDEQPIQALFQRYKDDIHASPLAWYRALHKWHNVLTPSLQLDYARCLFQRGDTAAAEQMVLAMVRQAGHQGRFIDQASALLVYSGFCRQQGRYTEVQRTFAQIQRVPRLTEVLQEALMIEQLHVALDREDRTHVAQLVEQLHARTAVVSLLRLEAYVLLGQASQVEALVEFLRQNFPQEEARVLTTLGRNAHDNHQFAQAVDCFQGALLYFEQQQDVWSIARTQMNLASALMGMYEHQQAKTLLDIAGQTMQMIQDRIGLSALQVNLETLSRMNRSKSS